MPHLVPHLVEKQRAGAEGQKSSRGESAVLQPSVQESHSKPCTITPQMPMRLMIFFFFFSLSQKWLWEGSGYNADQVPRQQRWTCVQSPMQQLWACAVSQAEGAVAHANLRVSAADRLNDSWQRCFSLHFQWGRCDLARPAGVCTCRYCTVCRHSQDPLCSDGGTSVSWRSQEPLLAAKISNQSLDLSSL